MSPITVTFENLPPAETHPDLPRTLTFARELDVLVLLRKLGPAFLARHVGLHRELIEARQALAKQRRDA